EATSETAAKAARLLDDVAEQTAAPAVLAMESQGLAMRGDEGDLQRARELGDRALQTWVPGMRPLDLAEHLHLHSDLMYWLGEYEKSLQLSRRTRALASEEHRAEPLLRGGGFEGCALTELGRHEEAIALFEEMLQLGRE